MEWLIVLKVVDRFNNSNIIELLLLIVRKILLWILVKVVFVEWKILYVDWNILLMWWFIMWLVSWTVIVFLMILEIRYRFDIGWKLENWLWLVFGFCKEGDIIVVLRDFIILVIDSNMLIIFLIVGSSILK